MTVIPSVYPDVNPRQLNTGEESLHDSSGRLQYSTPNISFIKYLKYGFVIKNIKNAK